MHCEPKNARPPLYLAHAVARLVNRVGHALDRAWQRGEDPRAIVRLLERPAEPTARALPLAEIAAEVTRAFDEARAAHVNDVFLDAVRFGYARRLEAAGEEEAARVRESTQANLQEVAALVVEQLRPELLAVLGRPADSPSPAPPADGDARAQLRRTIEETFAARRGCSVHVCDQIRR